jgi:putative OPT family oligopeptide transporter
MIGWWAHVPFWPTFGCCAIGGVLGVMYTVPLRRALVTNSPLPYPEGVAAAEVLKVGSGVRGESAEQAADGKRGLTAILLGSGASAIYALIVGTRAFAGEVAGYFRLGAGATGIGASMSLALLGAGHLMGIAVGMAMLTGLVIAWGVAVPILTNLYPDAAASAADAAGAIWTGKVRFIGAGAIGISAIWTLAKLAAPVWNGLMAALAAQSRRAEGHAALERAEQDIPIGIVAIVSGLCLIPMGILIYNFAHAGPLAGIAIPLTAASLIYIAVAGFLVAGVCGYMAGLIGSSNSPVSGLAILAVLGASLIVAAIGAGAVVGDPMPLVAFALLVTGVLLAVAVAANDNLQDLKTGQLVDATPWRQQAVLVVGVIAGSAMIPPILELLNRANGFAGAANLNAISDDPLPAPQATLISTIAKGVVGGQLDWGLIGVGALVGVGLILIDELLRRSKRYSLPPLGVGMAIYLPPTLTLPVVVGAVAGWIYDRRVADRPDGEAAQRLGVLVVSGLIVGESLFNVALSGLIVATNSGAPLALVPEGFPPAPILALAGYLGVMALLYGWAGKKRVCPSDSSSSDRHPRAGPGAPETRRPGVGRRRRDPGSSDKPSRDVPERG